MHRIIEIQLFLLSFSLCLYKLRLKGILHCEKISQVDLFHIRICPLSNNLPKSTDAVQIVG